MSLKLTQQYSSIVLNQNQTADVALGASGAFEGYIQEFHLPADYRRGTESGELRYPDLSGIQLLVNVAVGYSRYAAFDYEIQYQIFGLGWVSATSGTAIGAPSDQLTWMTAHFETPVPIDSDKATARWRVIFGCNRPLGNTTDPKDVIVPYANGEANALGTRVVVDLIMGEPYHFIHNGQDSFLYLDPADGEVYFSVEQGLTKFMFTSPNPLALPHFDRALDQNGSVITGVNGEGAFCFRVLALTAEDGVDFLGNRYRSVVVQNEANAISTALGADPDSYWLSKPNPSKFAVENLYFDMRKQGSTTYGRQNLVANPSFETGTAHWQENATGASGGLVQSSTWSTAGVKSIGWKGTSAAGTTFPGLESLNIPVTAGRTYSVRTDVKGVTGPTGTGGIILLLRFRNAANSTIGDSAATSIGATSTGSLITSGVAPAGAVNVRILCYQISTASSPVEFYMDSVAIIEGPTSKLTYFDGDMEGFVWSDVPHDSTSHELILPSINDVSSVVDRVVIDPITPGAYFNIYYSDEGDAGLNESQWESKLWTRVPQTYRMERRETHVFPEPVRAKYVKIEFSHLQARHYAPGNFQQSIRYKKHPKWVLDFFLARMQTDSALLAERVTVIYDALDLAYNYYLDDLGQEPQTTVDINNTALTQVTSFLSDRSDNSDRIDIDTLNKIDLVLDPYRKHPALRGYATTLLGDYARQTVDQSADYAVEGARASSAPSSDVSSLNRDRVVIEQNYPVMFFYLTCRHKYREIEAKFSYDRAYFAGVREIAFLRDNYMTAFDTGTYIEPAADTQNIERNEFI